MNKQRRKEIASAIQMLETAAQKLSSVCDDEEFAFDSMPENLQYSLAGDTMQENIDVLNEAVDSIEEVISNLEVL